MSVDRPHILALDGLRGIAILSVIVYHCGEWVGLSPGNSNRFDHLVMSVVAIGWRGVDLFFVLSGFLITGILLDSKKDSHYFINFYARRTLRIFPIYYAVVLMRVAILPAVGLYPPLSWVETIAALIYITNIWQSTVAPSVRRDIVLQPTWSLCIEEQFYLLWPLVVRLCSERRLPIMCVGMIAIALVSRGGFIFAGLDSWSIMVLTPCRLDSLAIGALIAVWNRRPGGLDQLRQIALWGLMITGAGFIAVSVIPGSGSGQWRVKALLGYTILDAFFGCLLVLTMTTRLRRVMELNWLRTAGKYSYAAYLLHSLIGDHLVIVLRSDAMSPIREFLARSGSDLPLFLLSILMVVTCTYAAAWISWRVLESPMLRLKRHFPSGRTVVSVST